MNRRDAVAIADVLGGEAVQVEDQAGAEECWAVEIERPDGRLVVVTNQAVEEFADRAAQVRGRCYAAIRLD